jgi:hypothetical protein
MINLDQLLAPARLFLGITTKGPFPGMKTTRRFNKPFAATVILVLEIALVTIQMGGGKQPACQLYIIVI